MKEEKYHLALDRYDRNILMNALNTLRENQIKEERPTDPVDDLILKVSSASRKKIKTIRDCNEER